MRIGKVADVNIVPHAGAIGCGIIIAMDRKYGSSVRCCIERERDEVRFRFMSLTDITIGVSSRRIEVTQAHKLDVPRLVAVSQNSLYHQL